MTPQPSKLELKATVEFLIYTSNKDGALWELCYISDKLIFTFYQMIFNEGFRVMEMNNHTTDVYFIVLLGQ